MRQCLGSVKEKRLRTSFRRFLFLAILLLAAVAHGADSTPPATASAPEGGVEKLVIVGDSTACIYPKIYLYRGWGQFLPQHLTDKLKVVNLAKPGRSLSSFIMDGLWKKALAQKPKFMLIQFGTNDAHGSRTREGLDAEVGFRKYLNTYIDGALAANTIPILITPARPRFFGGNGKLIGPLDDYAASIRKVAAQRGVAMIDLYKLSGDLFEKLGPEKCLALQPSAADNVHFNAVAANAMAELIVRHLPQVEPRIRPYLAPETNQSAVPDFGGAQ